MYKRQDLGFAHDRPALVDGLCGNRQCQRDIRPHLTGMEGALKTAPFQRTPVEYGMKVQGVVSRPVVVVVASVRTFIPFPFKTVHRNACWQLADFFQHGFPYFLAPALHPAFVDIQGFEQDILFGIHNRKGVFETLWRDVYKRQVFVLSGNYSISGNPLPQDNKFFPRIIHIENFWRAIFSCGYGCAGTQGRLK